MKLTSIRLPLDETGRFPYKWKVLITVVFGIFMVLLDTTVVNIAFRTLQEEFAAQVNDSQWIISVYVLALGISTPVSGYLGDRFGIKRVFLGGLAVFVAGSLLCGIAPNLWLLIAARALQGFGGGVALPLGTALLFAAFPPQEQGAALGIFGIAAVSAPALGPILGGWLVDQGLWRWIFFINVPIGSLGVYIGLRWLKQQAGRRNQTLDVWGLLTSIVGFGSILYAASIAANQGWTSAGVVIFAVVGGVALVLFTVIELFVAKDPLLDLRLFRSSVFTNAVIVGLVAVVGLFGAEFLLPLYLQILRGRTALETGFILVPQAISAAIMLPLAGRLYDRVGARPLMIVGFGILVINTWQLSQLTLDTAMWWIVVLLILRGIALGLTVQTTLVSALSRVPMPQLSRGSALINATRQVIQALTVAFLATILATALAPGLADQMETLQTSIPPAMMAAAQAGGAPFELCKVPDQNIPGLPQQVKGTIAQFCAEYMIGFERAYHWTFYAAILAMILGAFLPGWPFRWAGREQVAERGVVAAGH